ncbi:MAG: peptidoglycan DD-metalloendopeptidase family protein [Sphingomonadaceae bacterium]
MATLAPSFDAPVARPFATRRPQVGGLRLPRIRPFDLVVDLGEAIGSARWWQGLATLVLLIGMVASLGTRTPVLPMAGGETLTAPVLEERQATRIEALAAGSATGRVVPATARVVRLSEIPERPRIELAARIGANGSLEAALRRAGVGREDLQAILALASEAGAPRSLKPGTELALVLGRRETRSVPRPVESLEFRAAFELRLAFHRGAEGLEVTRIPIRIDDTPLRITGEVGRSLHASLRASGLPGNVISDYLRQLGHVVDIQRGVRGRDRFDLIVAHRRAETGEREWGQLLYAGLVDGRRSVALMRWGPRGDFYRDNGESARRGLIRTPVEGARLSSNFGMRFHPILGYSRMHQGIDFAAPTGTPVVASAAGRVVSAGWGGGYGNLVTIEHAGGMRTRYAHLSRITVKPGQQVAQGQRIGAVGSTGMSTGPHLHYEVWQNGKPVNPAQAKLLSGNQLAGAELERFKAQMAQLTRLQASAP